MSGAMNSGNWHIVTLETGYESNLKLWQEVWADPSLMRHCDDFLAGNADPSLRLIGPANVPRISPGVRTQLAALNKRVALQGGTPSMP
jgi:hypothetical protein